MNSYGRSQVRGNADKLTQLHDELHKFDFISSPIFRARDSMEIIRETLGLAKQDYHLDERLKELNYGEFSTHTWEELRRSRPQDVMQRFDDPWSYVIPKGECYAMLSKRVLNWLHDLKRDTIVTAHAGISRVIQAHFSNCPEHMIAFLEAPQDRILVIEDGEISWL